MREIGSFVVPEGHPCLPGHFPGRPIVPGVVLLDEVAAVLRADSPGICVAGFPSVRFMQPVRPGETVVVAHAAGAFACRVEATPVLRGTVAFR